MVHGLQHALDFAELAGSAAACVAMWRTGLSRRFRMFAAYLAVHTFATLLLYVVYHHGRFLGTPHQQYVAYCLVYWPFYYLQAGLIFFAIQGVLRDVLKALPGMARPGMIGFRVVAAVSVLISFAVMLPLQPMQPFHKKLFLLAYGLLRSVSMLELCMLAFLAMALQLLRLSLRSRPFGITLGFGLMAAGDLGAALVEYHYPVMTTWVSVADQFTIDAAFAIWLAYILLPEPARARVEISSQSAVYRWNEIAQALGHPGGQQVAVQPQPEFFLSDVETVVDRVLRRNSLKADS